MAGGMSVGGLASGLDTNSIISQLTALEQMKVKREEDKKKNAQDTLEKFKDLETRLGNLANKAAALDTMDKFNTFKALSNYEEYAVVSGGEGATSGQYELTVHQLATTQKVASKSFDATNKPLSQEGSIFLSTTSAIQSKDSRKTEVEVKISAGDTLKDIVSKINAAEGAGVRASIMTLANGENRLVLTAVDTGTQSFYLREGESNGAGILGRDGLGILSDDANHQKASSSGALVTAEGAATEETTFDELNVAFGQIDSNDKVGIYLPANKGDGSGVGGWITFDLFENGTARTIGDVLEEINDKLRDAGANMKAKLNGSGEIVMEGDLGADANFGASLKDVKIQIGEARNFDDSLALTESERNIKINMGTFKPRNIFSNVITDAQNAFYTVDGIAISSQSNSDSKTIVGTTFTLKKADPTLTVKLSLEQDQDALASKISEFVNEYNALMKFIADNSKTTVTEEFDEETGKKTTKRNVAVFSGDSNISGLRDNLKRMMTATIDELTAKTDNGYSTIYSSVTRIGITTGADGSLNIDSDKLKKALNEDFDGVRRLFTSNWFSDTPGVSVGRFTKESQTGIYKINAGLGTINGKPADSTANLLSNDSGLVFEVPDNRSDEEATVTFVRGIASQFINFVEKAKDFVDGYFKKSKETYQDRIDEIEKRVDQLQRRVNSYTTRLTNQFNALERSMANLQAQTSNMLSALPSTSFRK